MKKIFTLFTLLFVLSSSSWSQLFINEILVSNASVNYDPDFFNFASWIEIYNSGGAPVNVSGYYLTDNATIPDKWVVPTATIPANGYLIVWADKMNTKFHTNFSMSANGEFIGLYNASTVLVDSFSFLKQHSNISYGRTPDGAVTLSSFYKPTPRKTNSTPAATVFTAGSVL